MELREPQSINECVYYTNRNLKNDGYIKAWVFKEKCPKCGKGVMEKPKDPKTGKPKIRAKEYECPVCGYKIEKQQYENRLIINIQYTCPHCKYKGQTQVPFKRKKYQRPNKEIKKKETVEAIRFQCLNCKQDIYITKKMK